MGARLGQHLLVDEDVIAAICDAVVGQHECKSVDALIEIGPGRAALTQPLHMRLQDLLYIAIEKDEQFVRYLHQHVPTVQTIPGDAMDLDLLSGHADLMRSGLVSNLPYYITSPLLRAYCARPDGPRRAICMMQEEVARQITADADKKSFLWWCLYPYYEISYLLHVLPSAFDPPPRVHSGVVLLQRRAQPLVTDHGYLAIVEAITRYPRKTLAKTQKMQARRGITLSIPFDLLPKRASELTRSEFVSIRLG